MIELNRNSEFYCSVRQSVEESFRIEAIAGVAVGVVRSFSSEGYWDCAVPSVQASRLYVGICFDIKAGVAEYLYKDTAFAASLYFTVTSAPRMATVRIEKCVRFQRHAAPALRRFSCGHLTRKCTALTL